MITRDNYEEFFLLYGDNELSAAQRRAVEDFVGDNPDLKEEWDLLLQCRIVPDEQQIFANPEALLQHSLSPLLTDAAATINTSNYEEYLLACIDGELDPATRARLDAWISLHPSVQKEWDLLALTVSRPDPSIVFPDKTTLYRKQERPKIIWLTWGRIAVAAAFIGIITLLVFNGGHNNNQHNQTTGAPTNLVVANAAHTPAHTQPDKKTTAAVTRSTVDTLYLSKGGQNTQHIAAVPQNTQHHAPDHNITSPAPVRQQTPIPATGSDLVKTDPVIPDNPVGKYSEAGAGVAVIDPQGSQKPGNITAPSINAITTAREVKTNKNTSFATQALLAENTGDTEDGLTDDQAAPKKSKLRGFFRKVSRVIEKRTSRDDDERHEVLIAGFQIAQK